MWLKQAALLFALVSRLAMALFALDILAWTFGLEVLPPLEALLRLSIWAMPSLLPFFFPVLSAYLTAPVKAILETPIAEGEPE